MKCNRGCSAGLKGEHGGARLKAALSVGILAVMAFTGIKVIPVLINNFQFQDAIQSTARFASVNRQTHEDIQAAVLKDARNEDIPIQPADIHVKGEGGHVEISADYSVTVNMVLYQWTLNFHPSAKNNAL